jgi:hypothetical protein
MTATTRRTSAHRVRSFDDALAALGRPFPADAAEAARHYRRLARLLHPDTAPPGRADEAEAAFVRLTALWRRHTGAGPTLTTARGAYPLGPVLATGDLAVLRAGGPDTVLKIPRRPADNDLMGREADALTRLHTVADARHRAYAPRLVESFRHRGPDGTERRINALQRLRGFHTLAEVRALHPGGLDPRDAAWMWRRLLVALGWAHRAGIVHGAVLPEHVLIHPAQHGLALIDWCYSTERGDTVPALVERHRALYPSEVTGRRPATEATDIHLASACVGQLMGDRAPKPLRAFLHGCTLPAPGLRHGGPQARRPHDAWRLLAELDEVLERLYGPRTFRPFTMPGTDD